MPPVSDTTLAIGGVNLQQGQGRAFWLLTDRLTFKAVGADTNGAFTIVELDAGADGGPPPHVHRDAEESFYILEGTFDFSLAGQAFAAGPAAFVHLPKGVVHTHRAGGGAPAKALVIQSPAGVEHFIAELGTPIADPSTLPVIPDVERIVSVAQKHGIDVPPA
jgi:quercetin dioxygenase-like cupin family protein